MLLAELGRGGFGLFGLLAPVSDVLVAVCGKPPKLARGPPNTTSDAAAPPVTIPVSIMRKSISGRPGLTQSLADSRRGHAPPAPVICFPRVRNRRRSRFPRSRTRYLRRLRGSDRVDHQQLPQWRDLGTRQRASRQLASRADRHATCRGRLRLAARRARASCNQSPADRVITGMDVASSQPGTAELQIGRPRWSLASCSPAPRRGRPGSADGCGGMADGAGLGSPLPGSGGEYLGVGPAVVLSQDLAEIARPVGDGPLAELAAREGKVGDGHREAVRR